MNDSFESRTLSRVVRMSCAILVVFVSAIPQPGGRFLRGDELKGKFPGIVKTEPEMGATEVPSSLTEIKVTFDQEMRGGMSWTGGKPLMPDLDSNRKARWIDKRTCVLPVKLEGGRYYRVGINSSNYQNFKGSNGVAAPSSVIYFATAGAKPEVAERVRVPKIVKLEPEDGALEVDPSLASIRVTFDVPMGEGMSWTGGGESFPKSNGGAKASWSADRKTCTLPVTLESGRQYRLGLNSVSHNNFQSEWGVPLDRVGYSFKTK